MAAVSMAIAGRAADSKDASGALDQLRGWLRQPAESRPSLAAQSFASKALSKSQAEQAADALWDAQLTQLRTTRRTEWDAREIVVADRKLRFGLLRFGTNSPAPASGWPLFISMHGGGGAPPQVNDSQWQNQIRLGNAYAPKQGVYIAPRAPTDTWNLWHEAHVDTLFARLVEDAVALEGVDPDRVYLMGYSAGGDGVYQLTPRMADWFAAAAMSAGHPNETQPFGLRNVPFALQVGGADGAYNRNRIASEWGVKLKALHDADRGGYEHLVKVHEGMPHWMGLKDKIAIPWMESHRRNVLPDRIAWRQDDVVHDRFYWLAVPKGTATGGAEVLATRKDQQVEVLSATVPTLVVRWNDAMADLDRPVQVVRNGQTLYEGKPARTIALLAKTLEERGDRKLMFAAEVQVDLAKP
jgi:predicted esterase